MQDPSIILLPDFLTAKKEVSRQAHRGWRWTRPHTAEPLMISLANSHRRKPGRKLGTVGLLKNPMILVFQGGISIKITILQIELAYFKSKG
jgi:hypothetical protein